jgi:hypothetical protein
MKKLLGIIALLVCLPAFGQAAPVLTFTAQTTTGNGSVVPVLTWSTAPVATSCTASGDAAWSGTKAASGTQTLAALTASKSYNLTCSWPGQSSVTVKWTPPTLNTDSSPLTDLAGYKLYYSTSSSMSNNVIKDVPAAASSFLLTGLVPNPYFLVMSSVGGNGEGPKSPVVPFTVPPAVSITRTVGITVNPVPMAPTNITVE